MPITAEYDREADALYVRLRDGKRHRAVEIDDATYVNVDADERPIGIELLYPSLGLDLQPAVRRFGLEQQLAEIISAIAGSNAPAPPPTMTGGQHLASTAIVMVAIEGSIAVEAQTPGRHEVTSGVARQDRYICAG